MSATIKHTNDVDTLKQMATLLELENKTLLERNQLLAQEIAQLKGISPSTQLTLEIKALQEKVDAQNKRLFGDSSERRHNDDDSKKVAIPANPKTGHGPTKQPRLPVRVVNVELHEEERSCRSCGEMMVAVPGMTHDTKQVTALRRQFYIDLQKCQTYRCKCSSDMKTVMPEPPMVKGGRYSPEFAALVAEQKYLDHMPLDRQRRAMQRQGLLVSTSTLWDQINALAKVLEPTYDKLRDYIIDADVIGADETYWKRLDGRGKKRWWVWQICTPDAVHYSIYESRSAKTAAKVLDGFEGVTVCDAYKAYETVAKANPGIDLALCWSHARRYFIEAEGSYPIASYALNLIGKLFAIDSDTKNPALLEGEEKTIALEARAKARSERAPPILDALRDWAYAQRGLPKSSLRKAIDYMLGHWKALQTFLADPMIPLDNNDSERGLRGVVVGRKNHYGSKSKRGTKVAAVLYTIMETAKRNGIDPYEWVVEAVKTIRNNPGVVPLPLA